MPPRLIFFHYYFFFFLGLKESQVSLFLPNANKKTSTNTVYQATETSIQSRWSFSVGFPLGGRSEESEALASLAQSRHLACTSGLVLFRFPKNVQVAQPAPSETVNLEDILPRRIFASELGSCNRLFGKFDQIYRCSERSFSFHWSESAAMTAPAQPKKIVAPYGVPDQRRVRDPGGLGRVWCV